MRSESSRFCSAQYISLSINFFLMVGFLVNSYAELLSILNMHVKNTTTTYLTAHIKLFSNVCMQVCMSNKLTFSSIHFTYLLYINTTYSYIQRSNIFSLLSKPYINRHTHYFHLHITYNLRKFSSQLSQRQRNRLFPSHLFPCYFRSFLKTQASHIIIIPKTQSLF